MPTLYVSARDFARVIVSVSLATCTLLAHAAPASLALFGTQLKGASRTELRQTLTKAGLRPQRVDSSYFCDEYGVNGKLKGASILTVCYTEGDNRFASAQYTFPGFMNMQLVQRVIETVKSKYGPPASMSGDIGLGPVSARWPMAQGMEIRVSRGWPDTTTYLDLVDEANLDKMHAQMQADKKAAIHQQAEKDSNAF
ncbi:MAG: hypothetical protein AB7S53_05965 [Thiomonas sp.]